jgi:hypothetical protein
MNDLKIKLHWRGHDGVIIIYFLCLSILLIILLAQLIHHAQLSTLIVLTSFNNILNPFHLIA